MTPAQLNKTKKSLEKSLEQTQNLLFEINCFEVRKGKVCKKKK